MLARFLKKISIHSTPVIQFQLTVLIFFKYPKACLIYSLQIGDLAYIPGTLNSSLFGHVQSNMLR